MRAHFVAAVIVLTAGCSAANGKSALKAATGVQAEAVVRAFLDAAVAGDKKSLAAHVCDGHEQRAEAAVLGPQKIERYAVKKVEPAWVGSEPYFRVDVTLTRVGATGGADDRSLSVRAREGCIDRLLGEPLPAKRADGEIAL